MPGPNATPLSVVDSWVLPLAEASALGLRRVGADLELLAVDDDAFRLARSPLVDPFRAATSAVTVDDVFRRAGLPTVSSNFEAVAADTGGRVFLVQENDERVVVLAPDLGSIERRIRLRVGDDALGREWARDANSRAEGLLLLNNGHILVGKQRRRPWLVEFGPAGEPEGFDADLLVTADHPFPLPATDAATFDVLDAWPVARGSTVRSLNDLAVDEQGRLCAVSSASASFARLAGPLRPGGAEVDFETWPLPVQVVPNPERDKAEGLAFWPGHGWLVALDLGAHGRPNLFLLREP